ncbi:DUF4320 family protein [Caproicibacter fermentans]|uniref:DUF4320 family protein n=2 Tax=Caproicibacter fermentans TaxID=2576756 RepID=A0A7G8TF47_9FIRM|nr:DUF4320 family protein [Caproicibacter fermentans]QNK42238.1 DUF4320 family protein [Caproicibacter fermentans]
MMKKILKSKQGEGYLDIAIGVLCLLLVVSFAVSLFPVFTAKQQLDTFATEIVREAEIKGRTSVDSRIADMREQTGLDPKIRWNCDYYSGNKVQLDGDMEVVLTDTVDIGFFIFGPFPVEIQAKATGKSEVYYK